MFTMLPAYFPSHHDQLFQSGRTHANISESPEDRPITGRLVVIDDDPLVLRVLTRLFDIRGLAVVAMSSAAEALQYIESNRDECDVVVTDQTMPEMTGVQLAEILSKSYPDLPVLLCTGLMSQANKAEATAAGIRGIYQKPVDMKRILPDIAALLKT